MQIVNLSIRQPITISVGVILCILAGSLAIERVPIQLTPTVEDTVIAVTTRWENANPQEVEQEIIEPQEERLQGLTNLRTMTSTSSQGEAQIRLTFHAGIDKNVALREVSDKLREVPSYPFNVQEPVIAASDPQNQDYIAWFVLYSEDPAVEIGSLYDFVDKRLKPLLERVSGISEVGIRGGREREVQIEVDSMRLAQRGITYTELINALRTTNQNYSAGALVDGKSDIRIRAVGRFESLEQLGRTVIRYEAGGPVYLNDVASVRMTFKEATSFVRSNGRSVIALNFQRETGSNVIQVMRGLKAELEKVSRPGGLLDSYVRAEGHRGSLRLIQAFDQTTYIDDAIKLVVDNIYLGGSLAIAVLILFLFSVRPVLIIALAIPISVVGCIVAMVALGRSINVVSLAGMAFAIGMVVDNSIVVLENIYRHLEMGKRPAQAALDGTTEVAGAVVAATLTTVVVFIPILLIREEAGQLFQDIALAITSAVLLSLLVSLTVIPSAAALILKTKYKTIKGTELETRQPVETRTTGFKSLLLKLLFPILQPSRALGRMIYFCSGSYLLRIAISLIFVVVSLYGSFRFMPPIDYLPSGNRNVVFGIMNFPPGYSLERVREVSQRVENSMRPYWEAGPGIFGDDGNKIDPQSLPEVPVFAPGADKPTMVRPPPLSRYFLVGAPGQAFHGGVSVDDRRVRDLIPLFFSATRPDILPGTLAFAFQFPIFRIAGRSGAAVQVNIVGSQLEEVTSGAEALYGRLIAKYGVFTVQTDPNNFNIPGPELRIDPKLERLVDAGLTVQDLGLAVAVNGDGTVIGDYTNHGEPIDLKVISSRSVDSASIDWLPSIPLAARSQGDVLAAQNATNDTIISSGAGKVVTLSSVAEVYRTNAPQQIKRVGRQRAVTLNFTPPAGMPLEQAVKELDVLVGEMNESGEFPSGVDVELAGSASKLSGMRKALLGDGSLRGTLTSSLFLSLLIVYLLMCVLFQSYLKPLVILFSVPLAMFGGFLALALVHDWSLKDPYLPVQNLDVLTILGFVILAGVVVNNAILIVHQAQNFLVDSSTSGIEAGRMTPRLAISLAVESRLRPIMMSTLTSVGGMLPLVLMPGSGSELYRGLGSVVVGGLVVSTVFTLILVPMILSIVFDLEALLRKILSGKSISELP